MTLCSCFNFLHGVFFEHKALTSAVNTPRLWRRYVGDTFVILQQTHREEFPQHINSVDPSIHFTTEEAKQDSSMPFLETLVTPQDDGTVTTSVYRMPTHTDLYLQSDSHHNLACKYSVINTLTHRAKAVCSNSKLLKEELKHLHEVLHQCRYPKWAITKILKQQEQRRTRNRRDQGKNTSQTQKKCHIVVPYTKGICENYKTICSKYGVQVYFKGGNTLKNILMFAKDKETITKQSNIIYWYKCGRIECDDEYIGESARTFEERYRDHLKAPSLIFEHNIATGHTTSVENFKIIEREGHGMARTIKEAIYIRGNNPTLNRNIGKYNLPHIWDKVLLSIPELKTK